ncbi:MAG: hypothetical protein ACYDC2_06975 [Solirubrobacteraceae bacterium]
MRTVRRPRRYVGRHWLALMRPLLRYSRSRNAYILRFVGAKAGPVLRLDRRHGGSWDGFDRRSHRRHARAA